MANCDKVLRVVGSEKHHACSSIPKLRTRHAFKVFKCNYNSCGFAFVWHPLENGDWLIDSRSDLLAELEWVWHSTDKLRLLGSDNSLVMQKSQLAYLQCDKSGYHFGEVLNIVCLERNCLDRPLCCTACVEESHKNHQTVPLKLLLKEAQQKTQEAKPVLINPNNVFQTLKDGRKSILDQFNQFKQEFIQNLNSLENQLTRFYDSTVEEVKIKADESKVGVDQLLRIVYSVDSFEQLLKTVQKIISLTPRKDAPEDCFREDQVVQSISIFNSKLSTHLQTTLGEIGAKIKNTLGETTNMVSKIDVWTMMNYRFSSQFKHPQVQILSATVARNKKTESGNKLQYRFVLMEPHIIKTTGVQKLVYKIKENTSNWMAFGVCHKDIICSKNYSFLFNSIGHGAYMISSNGGSWSHIKPEFNNIVKTFKFVKNDVIIVEVNYDSLRIKFRKHGVANESYELDFVNPKDSPLSPCVLFYYPDDQVEFIQNFTL